MKITDNNSQQRCPLLRQWMDEALIVLYEINFSNKRQATNVVKINLIHSYTTKKIANLVFQMLGSYTNVVAESMVGERKAGKNRNTHLEEGCACFPFPIRHTSWSVSHTSSLGLFRKMQLDKCGKFC